MSESIGSVAHIRLCDMRARELFGRGDQVEVIGRTTSGRVLRIDPDRRLALVDTALGNKWYYLKDLRRL